MSSFDPSIQNTTWRRLDSIIVIIIINITPSNTFQNKSRCIFTKKKCRCADVFNETGAGRCSKTVLDKTSSSHFYLRSDDFSSLSKTLFLPLDRRWRRSRTLRAEEMRLRRRRPQGRRGEEKQVEMKAVHCSVTRVFLRKCNIVCSDKTKINMKHQCQKRLWWCWWWR